jgi:U4/U6 small nuclear ribonucleoprotein PRP31
MWLRFEKNQEKPPAKMDKPLPAPDDKPRSRRGGKRYQKMKKQTQLTEMRKY